MGQDFLDRLGPMCPQVFIVVALRVWMIFRAMHVETLMSDRSKERNQIKRDTGFMPRTMEVCFRYASAHQTWLWKWTGCGVKNKKEGGLEEVSLPTETVCEFLLREHREVFDVWLSHWLRVSNGPIAAPLSVSVKWTRIKHTGSWRRVLRVQLEEDPVL